MTALWVVITKDREGGYHIQLRSRKAGTRPDMQSAREPDPSHAQRAAEKIFGPLQWMTREQAGLDGQPYVVQVAEITVEPT